MSALCLRREIPIPAIDPIAWLRRQPGRPKIYWASRDGDFEMAGVGVVHEIVQERGLDLPGLFDFLGGDLGNAPAGRRHFGGICFDAARRFGREWYMFGAARFGVPRQEIVRRNDGLYWVWNGGPDEAEPDNIDEMADKVVRLGSRPRKTALPAAVERYDRPDAQGWRERVDAAIAAIASGALGKVVLAREARLETASPPDPWEMVARLAAARDGAYLGCFQYARGPAFVTLSPERLYRRTGRHIESEAVAGTHPRLASPETDARFARELLASDKERREHKFVVDALESSFDRLCVESATSSETTVVTLRDCGHLARRFEGTLKDSVTDAAILTSLHPTPAVAGHPTEAALAWIGETEPFCRGWYAGPIGWIGADGAEFAVGIRSALIDACGASLYSGAGLVPGSDPGLEWKELENKIAAYLRLFGLYDDRSERDGGA